jgi:hypothetical protein
MGPEVAEIVKEFETRAAVALLHDLRDAGDRPGPRGDPDCGRQGAEAPRISRRSATSPFGRSDTTFNGHLTFDQAKNNFWPTTQGSSRSRMATG